MSGNHIIRLKPWIEEERNYVALDFQFDPQVVAAVTAHGARLSAKSGHWLLDCSSETTGIYLQELRQQCTLVSCGAWPFNPERAIANQFRRKALSLTEVAKVLEASRNIKQRAMLSLLYSCGLRFTELVRIRMSDIKLHKQYLEIRAQRARLSRKLIVPESMVPVVRMYMDSYNPQVWLFEGAENGHQSMRGLKSILQQALTRAGLNVRANTLLLRNSLIVQLLLQGVDPGHVQLFVDGPASTLRISEQAPGNSMSARELIPKEKLITQK